MKKGFFLAFLFAIIVGTALSSCSEESLFQDENIENQQPDNNDDDGDTPDSDSTIMTYNGEKADDAADDVVGTDEDLYWEANSFTETITVVYEGTTSTVTTTNESVLYHTDGAYVTIDMQTNSVKNVEIIVSGKSDDGQLKIYGEKKFKLTLNGVELTSSVGPAINNQCKKRVFVHLTDGTTNRLTDASSYSAEPYYLNGAAPDDEDRKGCFFSEGNLIFSGTGVLVVEGKQKHGIATDGYFHMRPGVTIAVTDAAKNAIHVKGDEDNAIGIHIQGGLIYANTTATAGKCLKTDLNVEIAGGKLLLNTSGGSEYDSDENDTSSPACIKADGNVIVKGGTHLLNSTGTGGKGMNVDGTLQLDGGTITVTTTGGKYIYNEALDLTSSPKGIKADGNITINGGELNISVTGVSDGSEGLESKSSITINDGEIYIYAYDDAMNASTDITVNGGKVYCYAVNNDGIDSNGTLNLAGGLVIASGTTAPEEGFDCDNSNNFKITGGTLIGTGGAAVSPSNASTQRTVIYNGIAATKDSKLCILNSSGTPILTYELPRTMTNMSLFFSSPDLQAESYTVWVGGTLSDATYFWNGWYAGGTWSDGTLLGTFTSTDIVTTVGNSIGGGDNPGGGRPGNPREMDEGYPY